MADRAPFVSGLLAISSNDLQTSSRRAARGDSQAIGARRPGEASARPLCVLRIGHDLTLRQTQDKTNTDARQTCDLRKHSGVTLEPG
jgi:hypothetical protein